MSTSDISARITEALAPLIDENSQLKESIAEVRAMMDYENVGWQSLFGVNSDNVHGLELDEVKLVSEKARKKVAASALPKRAVDLHAGYVFGNNLEIAGTERDPSKKGAPASEVKFFENSVNQESIFSGAAKRELQYARFTDGNVLAFCDTVKKEVRRVPIYEIAGVMVNPDHPDEIWAWLRQWDQVKPVTGESETKQAWAYSNRYTGKRQKAISVNQKSVPVLENVTVVDLRCNRQVGWTFGIGDSLAGLHWAEAYGEVLRYGQIVNESLAKIVYKVVRKTQKGANETGVKMAGQGFGQGAVVGEGQDIQLVNSSQKSFDFTAARPLAAMAAAAWNVSNIDLLSDSSAAGSSYGAAQSLTEGVRNAMNAMREEWTQFFSDIFHTMGFRRPQIAWPPMERPDAYRMAQELTLYSIALTDEEYRAEVLDRLDIPGNPSDIPPMLKARGEVQKQAASPDQGQSNGSGGMTSTDKNDMRSDGLGEVLKRMQDDDFLRNLTGLVERLESATNQK